MSAKKAPARKTAAVRKTAKNITATRGTRQVRSFSVAGGSRAAAAATEDLLLVCLQDPFEATGVVSKIVEAAVPSSDGNANHQWRLESVMEMNRPRFFEGWATAGSFTIDLKTSVSASSGAWGGSERTGTAAGSCRIIVMRDAGNKVRFSLSSGAVHATEKKMPRPDGHRFLNGDIGFELNGSSGISAAAVAVVSKEAWSTLVAGSSATTKGLAFDGKWRSNLEKGDGDAVAAGSWSFAVMTRDAYRDFCAQQGLAEQVV